MSKIKKGKFIIIEGGDGAGKTTQANLLKKAFENKGHKVCYTHEPGGTKTGEAIRKILKGNFTLNPLSELFLFSAARTLWIEKIVKPAIKKGKIVISDRSFPSTFAYQGYAGKIKIKDIEQINKMALADIKPDLIIILDIDYQTLIKRQKKRGKQDRFEKRGKIFHNNVLKGYRNFSKNEKTAILINGRNTIEEIHKKVINIVNEKLHFNLKEEKF